MRKGLLGVKTGLLWKVSVLKGLRKFEHFMENGALGKMSVRKGHFGENWAAKVKTGLIQNRVCQKDLRWKLGLLGKNGALG